MVPDKIPTYHLSKADLENYLKDLFPVEKDDIKVKKLQDEENYLVYLPRHLTESERKHIRKLRQESDDEDGD